MAEKYIKLGKLTAIISFVLGSVIFGLFFLSSSSTFLFLGYGFIVLAGLINMILLIQILRLASKDNDNKKKLRSTATLMLLNIPVMIFYCWLGIILLNIMRITFHNPNPSEITDLSIEGCEEKFIPRLGVGERKTIWISIPNDCQININYIQNGLLKQETVIGYVTGSMGQKVSYKIGGKNEAIF